MAELICFISGLVVGAIFNKPILKLKAKLTNAAKDAASG